MSLTKKQKEQIITNLKILNPTMIGVFGSYVHAEGTMSSDIDVIVDFQDSHGFKYFEAASTLEKALGKKVDLVTPRSVSKHLIEDIKKTVEYIYGEKRL
jgi:predicted nucleotidyltransferase